MKSAVPLRHRLPNPPPHFVGRRDEVAALASLVRRAPVTVVWGLGGAGKTALVLRTLHARFPKRVPRTLLVPLRPGATAPDLEVARVLAGLRKERVDWPELVRDPDALAAVAIDLAESGPWWLVLDDLQHADGSRVASFLEAFARYARKSRLVATSRVRPEVDETLVSEIALGAMPEADLALLARRLRELRGEEALAVARAAGGSPWRLLQRLSNRGRDESPRELDEELLSFLVALSAAELPIPRDAVARVAPDPGVPVEELARRGLLERSAAGYRVHDVVRGMLPQDRREELDAAKGRVGAVLVSLPDAATRLEGVRLLLDAKRVDDAAAALAEHGDALLAEGFGPRLWPMLAAREEPALASIRLRCAVDLGSVEALARVGEPPPSAPPRDHLEWARALRLAGDLSRAVEVAGRVREAAERAGDRVTAFEAALLRGRCRIVQGDASEVLRETRATPASSPDEAARRDSLLAQAMTYVGATDEAVASARAIRAKLGTLSLPARIEVGCAVARVLYDASRFDEATGALDEVLAALGPSAMSRFHGRLALHMKMYLAQDAGRLKEARALLARLQPMASGSSFLRGSARSVAAVVRMAAGELDGLDEFLATSVEEAEAASHRNYRDMADGMRTKLATLEGRRAPSTAEPEGETPDPTIRAMRALWRIQNDQRHGVTPSADGFPSPRDVAANVELRVLARTVASERSLLEGDAAGAIADARTAVEWARAAGLRIAEAEACVALCDALVAGGSAEDLAEAVARLEHLASALPSWRFALDAALFRALVAHDPASLEEVALARESPGAARRSRALLGEGAAVRLDAVDARFVEAARGRGGWAPVSVLGSGGDVWGIDEARRAVWVAEGRTISFAKKLLPFRVLLAIAERGGAATKEELVRTVWGETEYHRLRHDNRLHLAILKLRRAIERDAKAPARVVATEDGYALAGTVRFARAPRAIAA